MVEERFDRGPQISRQRQDQKQGDESSEQRTQIRVMGNDGKLSDPIDVKIVSVGINQFSRRPELKYQLVKGTMTTYTAEWQKYEDQEGWMAYPMD